MKLCIVAVGASSIRAAENVLRSWESGPWAGRCSLSSHYVGSDAFSEEQWPRIFRSIYESTFLILDTMGVPQEFSDELAKGLAGHPGHIVVVNATSVAVRSLTRLGDFSLGMMRRMTEGEKQDGDGRMPDVGRMMNMAQWMEKLGRSLPVGPLRDMRNFFWISRYWLYGTERNIENMLYLIGREYFGFFDFPVPDPPVTIQDCAIVDPESGRLFATVQEYAQWRMLDPGKPGIGILFRTKAYPLDTHPVISIMAARLSEAFRVVPIGLDSIVGRDFKKLRGLLMPGGSPCVDVLINTEPFRLGQGPIGGDAAQGERFLRELNVPVLHPFALSKRTIRQWESDEKGADTGEFLISIFLPELDGCIETFPVAAVGNPEERVPELAPIKGRIEHLLERSRNWAKLRSTENRDKKIALVFYNYPPGQASVGSSAFLDTFASLSALLKKLAEAGYTLHPMSADELKKVFTDSGFGCDLSWGKDATPKRVMIDAPLYRTLTCGMPGMDKVEAVWGPFPGKCMKGRSGFLLPGIINGNVFIGLQPPRSDGADDHRSLHDMQLPPNHLYIAFYRWIEQAFQADALVHVGTHGTLEFLPGKEKALSGSCFPDALIGSLPHVYIYYSGNPSEAMTAKRRSHAVVIGHLPPPFRQGELYDDLQTLHLLLQEYNEARNLDPGRCPSILEDVKKRVLELGWEWQGIDDVHRQLHEIRTALVPCRLHTLGRGFSEEEIVAYLAAYFRTAGKEGNVLYTFCAALQKFDWRKISAEPHKYEREREQVQQLVRSWIWDHVIHDRPVSSGKGNTKKSLQKIASRGKTIADFLRHNRELDEIVRALGGQYIPPGLGGDMFRTVDILPSGRNLVQFDPRLVPSPSAIEHGSRIAEQTITRYREKHGTYPRSVAVVLWGLETSQTQGETVGQILSYLGVRAIRKTGNWETVLELIPIAELGRPRIDVIVQICGFFRDMFPNILSLLHSAFSLAGFAEEPDDMNFVRSNARHIFSTLQDQGMQKSDAREFSLARVFGPAASQYGTSLEKMVKERAWQNEADLVAAYIQSLRHVYTHRHHGLAMENLLNENLRRVDLISQIRGSREYEVTDLDHYYEFFGGLCRTVEQARGEKAMMLVSDSHEGIARTEDIADSIRRGVLSRLTNPVWLNGMLGHAHHGGYEIAKRMENLIGLAATTGAVDQAVFDRVSSRLVFDETMRHRIRENNPFALLDIIQRLWEAHTRGYWKPDDETLDRLKQLYLEAETFAEGARQ